MNKPLSSEELTQLAIDIKQWGRELGFQQVGITDTDLSQAEQRLTEWLDKNYHGEMEYMQRHGTKRTVPSELVPGTLRVISVRMDYLPPDAKIVENLKNKNQAYIARYAWGRDYHKVIRKRLHLLAEKISGVVGEFGYRAFVDSAPVMEKPLAEKAGLGWMGKHTVLINSKAGSWFFLGELYTDLPLPMDKPASNHCGSCSACMDICPTRAIVAPFQLDARRCIAYLTIEFRGSIPEEFRDLIGNRIFGCDDCQLICPWNKFAQPTGETDFKPRHGFDSQSLIDLFAWTEEEFLKRTEGSAIRRTGYEGWLRNIAIGLGNAPYSPEIVSALTSRLDHASELVREHVQWALKKQERCSIQGILP
jgi:epoxyqueuosine reductase